VTFDEKTQLPLPSHWSFVHRFASASHGVEVPASGSGSQLPVPGLHISPPSQGGFGAWQLTVETKPHVPVALHWSTVQRSASASHAVLAASYLHAAVQQSFGTSGPGSQSSPASVVPLPQTLVPAMHALAMSRAQSPLHPSAAAPAPLL
jgi:hypothetical protein